MYTYIYINIYKYSLFFHQVSIEEKDTTVEEVSIEEEDTTVEEVLIALNNHSVEELVCLESMSSDLPDHLPNVSLNTSEDIYC
jgi:hypothetical protein